MVQLPLEVVRLTGKGANDYLQGQVTADINSLVNPEAAVDAFVLEPTGKVSSLVTVTRKDDDLILLVDQGYGEALLTRLKRFAIRAKTEFILEGSARVYIGDDESAGDAHTLIYEATNLIPDPFVVIMEEEKQKANIESELHLDIDSFGLLRAERIAPLMRNLEGTPVFPATFPDIFTASVSLSKGCYTGQELVARMDSRGSAAPLAFSTFVPIDSVDSLDSAIAPEALTVEGVDAGKVIEFYNRDSKLLLATGYIKRTYADDWSLEFMGSSSKVRFMRFKFSHENISL